MACDVVVTREFSVGPDGAFSHGANRASTTIAINFCRPTRRDEGADWWYECTYQILVDGKEIRSSSAIGIDGVAALLRAMSTVVTDIETRYLEEWNVNIPLEYFDDMRAAE